MATTDKEREMRVAVERIVGFAKQFDEVHLYLACHAAFPLVLTPDLLYQIWANFVPEAPWTGVARVLLSRLCRQVGYEMYEMDIPVRNLLLKELKEQFGQERFDELAEFLLDYVAQRLTEDDPDTQDLREAQEWTALAYKKPSEVARELAEELAFQLNQEDTTEVFRMTSLVETFAEPLKEAGFEPLLIYTNGVTSFVRGDLKRATAQFSKIHRQGEQTTLVGVNLDVPSERLLGKSLKEISPKAIKQQRFSAALDKLIPIQKQVLQKVLVGETDAAISRSLKIKKSVVRKHIHSLCKIFRLENESSNNESRRSDLIAIAAKYKPDLVRSQTNLRDVAKPMEISQSESEQDDNSSEDYILVFSPASDNGIDIPRGSTPVDFAYLIHTEVGNQCTGAQVNGKIVKLDTPLKKGDIVKVITQRNAHPSLDWLNFVVTSQARNKIRQWYKQSHREENIVRGRDMLERELGKKGFKALLKSEQMQEVAERCSYQSVEDLLVGLGYGEVTLNSVVSKLRDVIRFSSK
ncbi:MAG: TGS domain-containing protein [Coleofasciculaceae cyanobacterium]